ncbi:MULTISPECIES: cation-translocating P-type ATPase [Streptomyces]|uniref:Calcium-transporting ATPase n=1 Tax=Streptomyces chartreusis NRRL 3882 TaxID=1079985 RepID=A0A2N9B0E1_STRCX|nr:MULTISPECIES: cation-translocating P-type ATPase [Streptomyces]MYS90992.1 HAD-IC family P-type ATPase [Streptomyces sp. SID5464]SOR76799.1 Calcium-transporting ATPase [Streptomyces chartreusis NRRL 3882]
MLTRFDVAPLVGAMAGAAAGAARSTAQGVTSVYDTTRRVRNVARNALSGGQHWTAGQRVHIALRRSDGEIGGIARKVAGELLDHPDVIAAYWDEGLSRLVITVAEDAVTDRVSERATALATRLGLTEGADPEAEEATHPGDPGEVRATAAAILLDAAGAAGALAGRSLRLPPTSRIVTATVTLLRENPRFRALLRKRFGTHGMELVLAAANAAAHGVGQTPLALVLDGVLRGTQLTEAVARAAAFEALHDDICHEQRTSLPYPSDTRPPLKVTPAQEYASHASTGSLAGAAATLLVTHSAREAAEAVLAGSPKAARYGPAAFGATLGTFLARAGILVRSGERLRQLEIADALVLHADALRSRRQDGRDSDGLPDDPVHPFAEAVLDAARRAGLHVVIAGGSDLRDITRLADEVAPSAKPFGDVVRALQDDGHVVVTVARLAESGDGHVAAGLPAGDVAIALTDGRAAVSWGADALAPGGLADVWRLLTAIPAARRVGRRSQTLARAGAALSGLLVARGGQPPGRRLLWPLTRHAPVNIAAANALLAGWIEATRVARATPPPPRLHIPWHALEPHEARARLGRTDGDGEPTGLALLADRSRQHAARVGRHPAMAPVRWTWQAAGAVRRELDDPLTPVLATGAVASALLGSLVDALLVVGAMDLNAVTGGLQRLRAEQALARLAARQQPKARKRDGRRDTVTVDAARLRPGDEITLGAGDVVPADARLLDVDGLEVDESALTGESLPVTKAVEATPGLPVAQRTCMVFEGTTVVAGRATALVVDTGDQTEAGRAVTLAARTPPPAGVQARLQELTRKALPVTFTGGAAVTGLSLLRGSPVRRAVSGGVAVAVAAVPEGLPLVATVAQMAAARRLSRRGVLVRTPRTLEALGRVDTVCFDKTGTLTENKLRLVRVATADGTVLPVESEQAVPILRLAARACPQEETGQGRRVAHATDEAVLDVAPPDQGWTPTGELPFEARRGYAAAVGRDGDPDFGELLVVKGAPETILPACRDLPDGTTDTAHELAGQGLRVLAVARRPCRAGDADAELDAPLADLEFSGFVALADVPRDTSHALLASLRRSGILPVMLTGDHPETARAIALQLGWPEETEVVTGDELVAMERRERVRVLRGAGVIARVAPEQKLHVVEALQQAGRVVAMAGDGANDAAAIRAADVGVGVEARGSAAARNAADLVLTSGDLSVLVDAVAEGRALWRSVADAVSILIGGNAGEVGFSVLGTLLAGASPLSTRQLLLVNLLTDMFPAMAVAVTPSDDPSTAEHAATGPMGLDVLGTPLLRSIRRRGVTTCLGAVTAYLIGRLTPGTERRSTTMALCGVVGAQLVQTLSGRRHSPLVWVTALGSAAVLAALVQTPGVSHFFGCTPLGPVGWAGVALAIALSALAPRLEHLPAVHALYDAAARLALRLNDLSRQARERLQSGTARPAPA